MIHIHDVEQGSPEWFKARLGIPTASMFSAILAKGEGKVRKSYMLKLAGEIITGEPAENYQNEDMRRGQTMEAEARDLYAFMRNAEPHQVGFITNGRKGCSPDSLIGDAGGLEIKTKFAHLLIECLLRDEGDPPPEHKAQLQGFLWVAEREWVDLACYWPKMPLYVCRVARNEDYIRDLASEVDRFLADLDETVKRIRRYGASEAA